MLGTLISSDVYLDEKIVLDISGFADGYYTVILNDGDKIIQEKFFKNN